MKSFIDRFRYYFLPSLILLFFVLVIIASSFASSSPFYYDDVTPSSLLPDNDYLGFIPLALNPLSVRGSRGPVDLDYFSGSGSWANVYWPQRANSGTSVGIKYHLASNIPVGSDITISVVSGSNIGYVSITPNASSSPSQSLTSSPGITSLPISSALFSLYDNDSELSRLGDVSSGSTSNFVYHADNDISSFDLFLSFGSSAGSGTINTSWNLTNFVINVDVVSPAIEPTIGDIADLLSEGNGYLRHISVNTDTIIEYLVDLSNSSSTPSAMEEFERAYLEKMNGQLSQVDDMLGPENTALPNGGDFSGFVSDVQDGLGISGSSFSASEFSAATSAFGGSSATSAGGPWEFFSQAVADSLAGDTQSVGLNDYDYIYQWFDMIQGRCGLWPLFSP